MIPDAMRRLISLMMSMSFLASSPEYRPGSNELRKPFARSLALTRSWAVGESDAVGRSGTVRGGFAIDTS
jgi:hypothetical protein